MSASVSVITSRNLEPRPVEYAAPQQAELQLPPFAMAASLGGFNVGVEIGQEAVVLGVMPLAFLLRDTRFYQKGVLHWGSIIIIAMAAGWLIQRAFDILIPGFSAILPA